MLLEKIFMKGFARLDNTYDLYLSMTWMSDNNHGICGHIYEIIDYYLLLHTKFKIGILICEDLNWETFANCISTKYDVSSSVIQSIKEDTYFHYKPKHVIGKDTSILFVDGGLYHSLYPHGCSLIFKNIFCFRCSPLQTHRDLHYKNLKLLQDTRVYDDIDNDIAHHYVKKINFKHYKKYYNNELTDTALLYLTSNCRRLCNISLLDIIFTYKFKSYLILTNTPELYKDIVKDFPQVSFPTMPIENIFHKFDTYIYTPTGKNGSVVQKSFDCSPRFIAECAHYGKNVIYHDIDDSYLAHDTGLKYRKYDIENDFQSLYLNDTDDLIDILYESV